MAGHEPEQVELASGQAQRLVVPGHVPARGVDREPVEAQPLLGHDVELGAPQHRANACGELARRERLRHVVVGAELEPDDAVGLLAAGGQHDHGQPGALADPAAELEAVRPGKHQVEDDEVRPLRFDELARGFRRRPRGSGSRRDRGSRRRSRESSARRRRRGQWSCREPSRFRVKRI